MIPFIYSSLIAFLVGAIPTGYLVVKSSKKMDIREHGSGNIGATNVFRVLGKGYGLLVFALDFIKGALPTLILPVIFFEGFNPEVGIWLGLATILGHIYTPFLKFKGGKGIATGAGVVFGSFPLIFLTIITVWLIVFAITRIVSVSSMFALLAIAASIFIFQVGWGARVFFLILVVLGFWTHKGNITRLMKGEEKRLN